MDIRTKVAPALDNADRLFSSDEVQGFEPSLFCQNGHLQTVVSSLLKRATVTGVEERRIDTPDGDFLEWDWFDAGTETPIVVLLHGLEGSSKRYYVIESIKKLVRNGFSTAALNFRSCGPHMNKTARFYHSGETGDIRLFVSYLQEQYPGRLIFAVGYSLGANVLLKLLGERGKQTPIQSAVAVSAPYDLHRCSETLDKGFNNVYQQYFLRSLKRKITIKHQSTPSIPLYHGYSLAEFDDKITAPLHGFKGVDDYYTRASCKQYIPEIQRPTLIIHSRKDPICPISAVPRKEITGNCNLKAVITTEGGHIGYFGKPSDYLGRLITSFLMNQYQNQLLQ